MADIVEKLDASNRKHCAKMLKQVTKSKFKKDDIEFEILRKENIDNRFVVELKVKKNGKNVDMTDLNPFIFVNPPVCVITKEAVIDDSKEEIEILEPEVVEENPELAMEQMILDTLKKVL